MAVALPKMELPRPGIAVVETTLLALAVLNGLAVRIVEAWRDGMTGGIVPGVSPFELVAVLVGLSLVSSSANAQPRSLGWRELLTAGLLVVPSSALAWVAVGGYAASVAHGNVGDRRRGALILLAVALAALWSSVGLRVIAAPVTGFEAAMIYNLLGFFVDGLVRDGNVIGQPGGHHLVLLIACTSAEALPRAVIAVFVVASFAGARSARRISQAALAAAVVFVFGNTSRLAIMGASSEFYALAHGPVGAGIFDGFQVALVIGAAYWASRE